MRIWLCALAVVLLFVAVLCVWLGRVDGVRTEEVVIPDDPSSLMLRAWLLGKLERFVYVPGDTTGLMLRGRMYIPPGEGPFPSVLLCHGISNSKENVEPLALALVQR